MKSGLKMKLKFRKHRFISQNKIKIIAFNKMGNK